MRGRVRRGNVHGHALGFIVTWDVDRSERRTTERVRRFVFGATTFVARRVYHSPGFIEKDRVWYLGQSVHFVPSFLLPSIDSWLSALGVDHEAIRAVIG